MVQGYHMRIRLALLLFPALLFTAQPCVGQELLLRSADASGMLVEYRPILTVDRTTGGDVVYRFDGAIAVYGPTDPDVRERRELIGLPALEGNRVTVLEIDYREERGVMLASIQEPRDEEDQFVEPERSALFDSREFLPGEIARLDRIGVARDRMLGDLVMAPVQWNPETRTARVYTRMLLRIDFGTPTARFQTGAASRFDAPALLNPEQAAHWILARPVELRKTPKSGMSEGSWYRIPIEHTGMYRLTRSWFVSAGIDVATLDPRTIRMFNSGGRELPANLSDTRPDPLQEIAIEIVGGDDGSFDEGDYVQFYARGSTGFTYNPNLRIHEHYINRFTGVNACLLTFGGDAGKRMSGEASLSEPDAYTPPWFTGLDFEEEEITNLLNSGKMWFGKRLVPGAGAASSIAYTKRLHGLVRTQPVVYRVQVIGASEVSHAFTVRDAERELGSIPLPTVNFSTDRDDIAKISGPRSFTGTGQLADDRSTITLTYTASSPERSNGGYVDWVEWHYARRFVPLNDELSFSAPDTNAVIQFELNGFTMSDIHVYDVTDFANVAKITNLVISGGTVRFQIRNSSEMPRQFVAVAAPAWKAPQAPSAIAPSRLLESQGAEYIIVTNDDMRDAARRLKAHREREGEDHVSTMVVSVREIQNEFASSLPDPTAIRDFLAYAMHNWTTIPAYVLFLGDGHYDYRNYTTQERIIVPVAQSENSINLINSYVSDDFFAMLVGNDTRVDLATGRIPIQSPEEADAVVDKIIRYEALPDFDPWRNRLTFVADDGWTTFADVEGSVHTRQSEDIARNMPRDMEQSKIYIVSYRTEITSAGRRKPDVNTAIIDQINEGSLVMNYTGHGAYDIWAHERVFVSDVTIPQLRNRDRLTFISAATCTFGLYDAPGIRSGTELLLLKPDGGIIAGLSAPRVVFSNENSAFNSEFMQNLINRGREADGRAKRMGDAIYASKQRHHGVAGYEKFHLFGDPASRLALPRYKATLERITINDEVVTADTAQLRAFSKVMLEGSVRRSDGEVWTSYNGISEVTLFDADRLVRVDEPGWDYSYPMTGGVLYRGKATVREGLFTLSFIVPKDISYENNTGRVSIYFNNESVDGAGHYVKLRVGGSDTTSTVDDQGPIISLYMDTRTFQPGDLVNSETLLIADLYDESGINTTGLGIGHDIEAWLDDDDKSIVLNEHYTGDVDSYQRGTVEYRLRGLDVGPHRLRLRAWDIFNNSSMAETHFVVAGASQLTLQDVLNYPNPMTDNTVFTFRHNMAEPVNVDIKVYTLSGRLVRTLTTYNIAERFVQIPWEGTDEDGDALANGVYFYKVVCRTIDGSLGSETLGRLSLLR